MKLKGDESAAPGAAMSVIWALVILGILVTIILMVKNFQGSPADFISFDQAYPDMLSTESIGSFQLTDLNFEKAHTTATEVACAIARTLREDFQKYGYGTGRPESSGDYKILDINKDRTIVGRGAFRINWNNDTGNFWAFQDLQADQQADLMKQGVCLDADATSWQCDTPYLDEKCVSNGLGRLKIKTDADNWLCTAKSGVATKVTAGGLLQLFGNEKCPDPADGQDTCSQLCPAGDSSKKSNNEMGIWRAPGGSGITEYVDDQDWNTEKGWPPYQCISGQCEPLYAWFLLYNKKNKNYEVDIARMAENINMGGVTSDELITRLMEGGPKFRDIETDYAYPELRTRYDLTFTPTDNVTFTGLLTKFTDKLNAADKYGPDWNVAIDNTCEGDGCYDTAPIPISWKSVQGKDPVWPSAPLAYDQATDNKKKRQELMKVNVRTNIQSTDNYMETTHTYRLVMRWWRLTHDTGYDTYDCGILPAGMGQTNCVACLENNGYSINKRWGVDCWNEGDDLGGYFKVDHWKRYQDQALIIVDLGENPTGV